MPEEQGQAHRHRQQKKGAVKKVGSEGLPTAVSKADHHQRPPLPEAESRIDQQEAVEDPKGEQPGNALHDRWGRGC